MKGNETMKTPQIALIGTEGAGKTVLVTVLAKKLATPQNGVWLNPKGVKTGKYIENTWNTLRRGEWIPSTPAGTLFDLTWVMRIGDREYPMKAVDSAGQDLRKLFSDEGFNNPNLSDQDQQFIEYIHSATILLVLVNLRDFVGEPDEDKRIENAFTLKGLLDKLQEDKEERQVVFLFTAYDLYEETIHNDYGTPENFFEQELPYLYHAYISGKPVRCFPVAAVAETEVKHGEDGIPRRVPAPNFRSQGLDPFIQWLAEAVSGDITKQEQKAADAEQQRLAELQRQAQVKKRQVIKKIGIIVAVIVCAVVCTVYGCNRYIEAAKRPKPVLIDNRWECSNTCWGILCTDDHPVVANVPIMNIGNPGYVDVVVEVQGQTGHSRIYLARGESKTVTIKLRTRRHGVEGAVVRWGPAPSP